MKNFSILLLTAASLGEMIAGVYGLFSVHVVCKPMIMIALAIYYFYHARDHAPAVWLALLFSLAGDVALLWEYQSQTFFMVGLGAFLVAHIFYSISYHQNRDASENNSINGIQKLRLAFPVVLAGTGLLVVLYPALGVLRMPVAFYALILVVMVLNAVFRFGQTSPVSFWMVFGGAILFLVSDALLAIHKFLTPIPLAHLWIMSTYILAQFLIINGLCVHVNQRPT